MMKKDSSAEGARSGVNPGRIEVYAMDGSKRKLVVLSCMHRSGSSLTANLLQRLGMSLGPFELIAAAPSNPYGHFEALPFHVLNRRVQEWAFGFADDVPSDPAVLARFLETRGAWPTGRPIPREWVDEGEAAVRALIESGPVAGFKDPRTPLVWPFWERVFERFDDVGIVTANLLRSPHEIAMSLCSRSEGAMAYWTALDVVGVHLERMKAAADGRVEHVVRFGTPRFWDDMKALAAACGLTWDETTARDVYDPTCVHHKPAVVSHPAQAVLDDMGRDAWAGTDPAENAARLARDARKYEAVSHARAASLEARGESLRQELDSARQAIAEGERGLRLALSTLEHSDKQMARMAESLTSGQERRVRAEQLLELAQERLAQTQARVVELDAALDRARQREEKRWRENVDLRQKLDKYESHAILGAALRGRRQIRQFWLKLRHPGPHGEPRASRVDRPV